MWVGLAITSVLALHTLSLLIFERVNETKPVLGKRLPRRAAGFGAKSTTDHAEGLRPGPAHIMFLWSIGIEQLGGEDGPNRDQGLAQKASDRASPRGMSDHPHLGCPARLAGDR